MKFYQNAEPTLKLEEYFNGKIKAWGLVQDYKKRVRRRFDVSMQASWQEETGTLEEDYQYYDGKSEKRIWTIQKIAPNHYHGFAEGIIGKAVGNVAGNAVNFSYRMKLEIGGKIFHFNFDDWMFLMNDGILINRSYLKKFGFTVAELTLFMQKQ